VEQLLRAQMHIESIERIFTLFKIVRHVASGVGHVNDFRLVQLGR
jgi:hypothetical protein